MLAETTPTNSDNIKRTSPQSMLVINSELAPEHQEIFPLEAQTFLSFLCAQFSERRGFIARRARAEAVTD